MGWSLSGVENRPKLVPVDSQSTQTEVQLLLDNWTQAEPSTTDVASSATTKGSFNPKKKRNSLGKMLSRRYHPSLPLPPRGAKGPSNQTYHPSPSPSPRGAKGPSNQTYLPSPFYFPPKKKKKQIYHPSPFFLSPKKKKKKKKKKS